MIRLALIAAFLVAITSSAEARHRHPHNTVLSHTNAQQCEYDNFGKVKCGFSPITASTAFKTDKIGISQAVDYVERIVSNPTGCPRTQFCGCGASVRIFGHPVRDLYLAANWFRFAHASPAPGMVAVRSHHVFVIEQVNGDGTVVAYDANSGGHATRIHTVSLSGYSVRDPHSRQVAMR